MYYVSARMAMESPRPLRRTPAEGMISLGVFGLLAGKKPDVPSPARGEGFRHAAKESGIEKQSTLKFREPSSLRVASNSGMLFLQTFN
jgi:hypothetical protein